MNMTTQIICTSLFASIVVLAAGMGKSEGIGYVGVGYSDDGSSNCASFQRTDNSTFPISVFNICPKDVHVWWNGREHCPTVGSGKFTRYGCGIVVPGDSSIAVTARINDIRSSQSCYEENYRANACNQNPLW